MPYMMARAYAHVGMTEMKRKVQGVWTLASASRKVHHPELGECWVGAFVEGIGAFDVHFPIDDVRPCTDRERRKYTRSVVASDFAPSYTLPDEDFLR